MTYSEFGQWDDEMSVILTGEEMLRAVAVETGSAVFRFFFYRGLEFFEVRLIVTSVTTAALSVLH